MEGHCRRPLFPTRQGNVIRVGLNHSSLFPPQAKLSHNSLCSECVFVCPNTSRWKIGGFEAAALHSKINHSVRLHTDRPIAW